ncbi:NADP-dependent oxidoreductase domain-containing protein [Mycena capillaripes]|nr:NADP-dependent oxidoreductase domain-containing protein [Mycena capillaripes]
MALSVTRKIGNDSTFFAIGFGAMGISGAYGDTETDEERFKAHYLNLAENVLLKFNRSSTLNAHVAGCTFWDTADVYADSDELWGKRFNRTGKRADIFLATKFEFMPDETINGRPEILRAAAEASAELVKQAGCFSNMSEGKVKHLGLSEISASTIRALAVHPVAAVQVEYSVFTLDIEDPKINLLNTACELGVKIVAYAPKQVARYSAANFPNILKL